MTQKRQIRGQKSNGFTENQAFLRSYDSAPLPPPLASSYAIRVHTCTLLDLRKKRYILALVYCIGVCVCLTASALIY
jgi:hypothetical protein